MRKRKICVVTGSRAEYGLLYCLMIGIKNDPELKLQIIATGMHLSPEFGLTYKEIEEDGFPIDAKVEMLMSSDTPVGISKSVGLGVIGFAEALDRLQPDILVVLGDRFEILAATQAALIARIPIAHIAGGDTTEGAIDESIRHSITKMAHLHFVTNDLAALRVRQLGENPTHIFNVGSPANERIKKLSLMSRQQLEQDLEFTFKQQNLLITFHPATLDDTPAAFQFAELLKALDNLNPEIGLIFTKANADTNGRIINKMIDQYVARHPNAKAFMSLGQHRYFSLIAQVDAVVGNSSSGLYEVPSFNKTTVNIGDRQKGRMQASSVISCPPHAEAIVKAIKNAFKKDCSDIVNPYFKGNCSGRIIKILKKTSDLKSLVKKHFFEVKSDG